ncbi:MAG: hypothetical protein ABI041_13530 [Bdellovibrionia bacterium]
MKTLVCLFFIALTSANVLADSKSPDKAPILMNEDFKSNDHMFSLGLVYTGAAAGGTFGETGWPKISAKYWTSSRSALDLAIFCKGTSSLFLGGDYLFHFSNNFAKNATTPYIGIGGILTFNTYTTIGSGNESVWNYLFRLPIGVDIGLPTLDSSLSVELVPLYLPVTSSAYFNLDLAFRYYL